MLGPKMILRHLTFTSKLSEAPKQLRSNDVRTDPFANMSNTMLVMFACDAEQTEFSNSFECESIKPNFYCFLKFPNFFSYRTNWFFDVKSTNITEYLIEQRTNEVKLTEFWENKNEPKHTNERTKLLPSFTSNSNMRI